MWVHNIGGSARGGFKVQEFVSDQAISTFKMIGEVEDASILQKEEDKTVTLNNAYGNEISSSIYVFCIKIKDNRSPEKIFAYRFSDWTKQLAREQPITAVNLDQTTWDQVAKINPCNIPQG